MSGPVTPGPTAPLGSRSTDLLLYRPNCPLVKACSAAAVHPAGAAAPSAGAFVAGAERNMRIGDDARATKNGCPGAHPPAPGVPGRTLHLACGIAQANHGDRGMTQRLQGKFAAFDTRDDTGPP